MNNNQLISKHNTEVIIWLFEELQASNSSSEILKEFSKKHETIQKTLLTIPNVFLIDTKRLDAELHHLFDHHQLGELERSVFTIISLLLITLKYTINGEQKVSEFKDSKRQIPIQKKFFEVLSKHKREKRNPMKTNGFDDLMAELYKIDLPMLKIVNNALGKNMRTEGFNFSILARLLFNLLKEKSARSDSDNELILSIYNLFCELYPEFNLLQTEEEWLESPSDDAPYDNYRAYQIKTIKTIIYYDNKKMFEGGEEKVDLREIIKLLADSIK